MEAKFCCCWNNEYNLKSCTYNGLRQSVVEFLFSPKTTQNVSMLLLVVFFFLIPYILHCGWRSLSLFLSPSLHTFSVLIPCSVFGLSLHNFSHFRVCLCVCNSCFLVGNECIITVKNDKRTTEMEMMMKLDVYILYQITFLSSPMGFHLVTFHEFKWILIDSNISVTKWKIALTFAVWIYIFIAGIQNKKNKNCVKCIKMTIVYCALQY